MGLLKVLITILLSILFLGCSKAILFKHASKDVDAISVFGKHNQRSFYIDKNVQTNLSLEWNSSTYGSYGNTTFSAYDSLLLVPDLGGRITALHIDTGKKIGELKYQGEIEQALVINHAKLIFIVNEFKENYSTLVVYNLREGKELEKIQLKGKFNNELISIDDYIITVSDNGIVYKITNFGKILWQLDLSDYINSNPAADEKYIYIASVNGILFSVYLDSGEINYQSKISDGFQSGITLENKSLFLGDKNGILFSISKIDHKILWKYDSNFKIISTPALDKKRVYFGNLNGDFYSIDKQSGKLIWKNSLDGLVNTSPLITQNLIIQPNLQKHVDILDIEKGEILQQIQFDGRCRTTPTYFNGKVYFGVDKGEVFCYSFTE